MRVCMTDAELELAILRKYVEHFDSVGADAVKCQRELDMREVIAGAIGRSVDEGIVARWHVRLAPRSPPYPAGVLNPCSESTASNAAHRSYTSSGMFFKVRVVGITAPPRWLHYGCNVVPSRTTGHPSA